MISDNLVQVMSLQEGHGGWNDDMRTVCHDTQCLAVRLSVCLSVCPTLAFDSTITIVIS